MSAPPQTGNPVVGNIIPQVVVQPNPLASGVITGVQPTPPAAPAGTAPDIIPQQFTGTPNPNATVSLARTLVLDATLSVAPPFALKDF